jgi:hypothetical protein
MRVALLLSGQMRTFDDPEVVKKYYELLINPLNADIFISTWANRGVSWCHGSPSNSVDSSKENINIEDIKSVYTKNLIAVDIENLGTYEKSIPDEIKDIYINGFEWCNMKIKGTSVPQLYKIKKVNKMKMDYENANGFKYDLVIRSRPDNIIMEPISSRYLEKLNTHIYAINCPGTFYPNRIYDIFFYGSSENMDKLSDTYNNIKMLENDSFNNGLHQRDTCRLLYVQAIKNGLQIVDMDYNICFIKR